MCQQDFLKEEKEGGGCSYAETVSQMKLKQLIQNTVWERVTPSSHKKRLHSLSGEIKFLVSLNPAKCHRGADWKD